MLHKLSRLIQPTILQWNRFSKWLSSSPQRSHHRNRQHRILLGTDDETTYHFSSSAPSSKLKSLAFLILSLYLISSLPQQIPEEVHLRQQFQRSILENRDDFSSSSKPIDFSSLEKNNATIPHFFIIGARKGGTASLSSFLSLHPSICMIDEPNFWNNFERWNRGYDWYYNSFYTGPCHKNSSTSPLIVQGELDEKEREGGSKKHDPKLLYGEKGNGYLFRMQTPVRLRRRLPDSKFIVLLRNPVERLYSHWWNDKCFLEQQQGGELTKSSPLSSFENLVNSNHTSIGYGYYAVQLRTWFNTFDKSKFLIFKSESFFLDPLPRVKETLEFLGVSPPSFDSDVALTTTGGQVPGRVCSEKPPPMSQEMRRRLEDIYRPSVKELETLLGRSFDWF